MCQSGFEPVALFASVCPSFVGFTGMAEGAHRVLMPLGPLSLFSLNLLWKVNEIISLAILEGVCFNIERHL